MKRGGLGEAGELDPFISVREPEHEMASPDLWHTCRICRQAFFETMKPEVACTTVAFSLFYFKRVKRRERPKARASLVWLASRLF